MNGSTDTVKRETTNWEKNICYLYCPKEGNSDYYNNKNQNQKPSEITTIAK